MMLCETYACARWGSLDLSARTSQADQLPQPMPLPLPLMHIVAGSGIIWRYGRRGPGDLIHRTEVMSELLLNMSIEIYTTGIPVFRSLLSRKFSSFLYSFYLEQVWQLDPVTCFLLILRLLHTHLSSVMSSYPSSTCASHGSAKRYANAQYHTSLKTSLI